MPNNVEARITAWISLSGGCLTVHHRAGKRAVARISGVCPITGIDVAIEAEALIPSVALIEAYWKVYRLIGHEAVNIVLDKL